LPFTAWHAGFCVGRGVGLTGGCVGCGLAVGLELGVGVLAVIVGPAVLPIEAMVLYRASGMRITTLHCIYHRGRALYVFHAENHCSTEESLSSCMFCTTLRNVIVQLELWIYHFAKFINCKSSRNMLHYLFEV
jgi:hypothetical protein